VVVVVVAVVMRDKGLEVQHIMEDLAVVLMAVELMEEQEVLVLL
jgi:hypothetical protein